MWRPKTHQYSLSLALLLLGCQPAPPPTAGLLDIDMQQFHRAVASTWQGPAGRMCLYYWVDHSDLTDGDRLQGAETCPRYADTLVRALESVIGVTVARTDVQHPELWQAYYAFRSSRDLCIRSAMQMPIMSRYARRDACRKEFY